MSQRMQQQGVHSRLDRGKRKTRTNPIGNLLLKREGVGSCLRASSPSFAFCLPAHWKIVAEVPLATCLTSGCKGMKLHFQVTPTNETWRLLVSTISNHPLKCYTVWRALMANTTQDKCAPTTIAAAHKRVHHWSRRGLLRFWHGPPKGSGSFCFYCSGLSNHLGLNWISFMSDFSFEFFDSNVQDGADSTGRTLDPN